MAAIILPGKWARQPPVISRIDLSNPITKGITAAFTLLGTGTLFDVVNTKSPSVDTSGTRIFRGGIGRDYSGTANTRFSYIGAYSLTGPLTIFAVLDVDALSNYGAIVSSQAASATEGWELRVGNAAGGSEILLHRATANAFRQHYTSANRITAGEKNVCVAVTSSSGLIETVPKVFVRGSSYFYGDASNVSNSGTGAAAVTGTPDVWIGRRLDGATQLDGGVLAAYLFNRALSESELFSLSENPWQVFRKSPRVIYFDLGAGGGATITGDSGSYTLTGTAATLKAGRKLAADSGAYNLTGTAATLKVGRKLTADSGTYTLTGTAVAFKRGYALSAESGTYTVSGTTVNLKAGRKLTADSGSYTLTGTDVTLNYSPAGSYNLTAESGTYTLTGTAATLKVSRKLTADSAAYTLTGTDVTLSKGVKLTADSGSYTLTGANVAFARTYVLTAESGAYTLTGTSAGLTWSGAPAVEVPTNGGPSIYGKPVFREKQFRKEYEEQVKRIEDEKRLARILREDEEITVIMALMAA